MLPVLAGIAAIPIIAAIGRRVAGERGGVWAAVIGAIAPALLVSSLDARMYMLATTLVLASTLCLLRALDRPSALRWALYAGVRDARRLHRVLRLVRGVRPGGHGCRAVPARAVSIGPRGGWARRAHPRQPRSVDRSSHGRSSATAPERSGCPSSASSACCGGLEQFFTGPPMNTWVNGFAAVRAMELAGDVAGVLLFAALILNRRRLTRDGAASAGFLGPRRRDRGRGDGPREPGSPAGGRAVPQLGMGRPLPAARREPGDPADAARRGRCRSR